jgi:hypothetical protein
MPSAGLPTVQTAYVVPDVKAACVQIHELYGIGPFFWIAPRVRPNVLHFGRPIDGELVTEAALAQSGDVMIELLRQHSDGPSAYRDMFAPDAQGFHHIAVWVDDYPAERDSYVAAGYEIAMEMDVRGGARMCYVDTRRTLGHMLELLPRHPALLGSFSFVRERSKEWDGNELIIPMPAQIPSGPLEID